MGDAKAAASSQRYRFRVRTADGQEVVSSVIELLSRNAKLKNPRWADGSKAVTTAHQGKLSMQVDAPGMDGRTVRFNVERLDGNAWVAHATALGVVKGGVVATQIEALHPAAGDATASRAPVPLRFKAELA